VTKHQISLSDLLRLNENQTQVIRTPMSMSSVGGVVQGGINPLSHPTVADLTECLFFSPGDGRIWLQDQRMVLMHSETIGSLRRELIESVGLDKARGLFTRAGYTSGARDAQLVRKQWPDADPEAAAIAGTRLHALEGVVTVEVVQIHYDPDTGNYQGEFLWHNSSEDDEHIAAYGIGSSPACWMQVGYATGYVSTLFGKLIVFREVNCRSSGDAHCRVIGKSVELWDDAEVDLRHLNAKEFLGSQSHGNLPVQVVDIDAYAKEVTRVDPVMVGASSAFNAACHMLDRVAPTSATVLFTGESGVGKEMFASMLHRISSRKEEAFLAVNCAAIPEALIESELFGVERGAYTGATQSRPGRFERAKGGTLFLDEIGTLSFVAQGKLLRALQEGEIERVGGTRTIKLDVRVIAATNVDLRKAVRDGTFREDLFFRLNVFPIHLPPLRDRRDDIPLLMGHFLSHYKKRHKRETAGFSQASVRAMLNYHFPGNIRELQNLVERGVILVSDGEAIDVHHLFSGGEQLGQSGMSLVVQDIDSGILGLRSSSTTHAQQHSNTASPYITQSQPLEQAEITLIRDALRKSSDNIAAAARQLGISRAKLAYRAKKFGLIKS
jgi:two-component system, NtrC family, response regulator HydG